MTLKLILFILICNFKFIYPCCISNSNSTGKRSDSGNQMSYITWDKRLLNTTEIKDEEDLKNNIITLLENNLISNQQLADSTKKSLQANTISLVPLIELYKKMTNDIFTHEAAITFITFVYLLQELGITNALSQIILNNKITYWSYYNISTQGNGKSLHDSRCENFIMKQIDNKNYNVYACTNSDDDEDAYDDNDEIKNNNESKTYANGSIFIDNKKYKYLRCDGCNDGNCVSCKLRNFLIKEGLLDKNGEGIFLDIFKGIGTETIGKYAKGIKKIIISLLKDEFNTTDFYDKQEINELNIDNKTMGNIKKAFFIEWALTYLFIQKFCNLFYNGEIKLFRSLKSNNQINEITKISPFESTSIFGPIFLSPKGNTYIPCYNFFCAKNVPSYRCIYNYVISPNKEILLKTNLNAELDYEQEIGFIPINLQYEKMEGNNNNDNTEHFLKGYEYMRNISKNILEKNICTLKNLTQDEITINFNEDILPFYIRYKKNKKK